MAFLYEPMAAAFDYERGLDDETLVLVVDIGGGTTDCSFVRVGPDRIGGRNRDDDVLGHGGERLGGNDYDQMLALKTVMPTRGMGDALGNGRLIANGYFVDAVSTNDVNAQQRFYSAAVGDRFEEILKDCKRPERFRRLLELRLSKATYRLLREAELAKIALSDAEQAAVDLTFLEAGLQAGCSRADLRQSSQRLLEHLAELVGEAIRQGGARPDALYLTGGMARSAVVRSHLQTVCGNLPIVDSDHFVSVTRGLTLWAGRIFGPEV